MDIKILYPNSFVNNYQTGIRKNLIILYQETNEIFILIIDEWDYIFSSNKFTNEEQEEYIYIFFKGFNKR